MTWSGKQPKLVCRSRSQLQEGAPVPKHHVALYSITSDGKASVRRERLSGGLLPTQRDLLGTAPASGASQSATSQPDASGVYDADDFMGYVPSNSCEDAVDLEPGKRKRTAGDHPLALWEPECSTFLDEMLCLEGRGDFVRDLTCEHCKTNAPEIRCRDCFGLELLCLACTVHKHARIPLHRVEQWNGSFFEHTTLKTLGLRIQLGHRFGEACCNPHRAFNDDFVIMDNTGIHKVALDFCGCGTMQTHIKQLLHARLFPATVTDPKMAATFRVLEQFHVLSFELKASAFEFYQGLARLSDNVGIDPPKAHLLFSFLRMVHEWRILKLLKRSARGHYSDGVQSTGEGDCAVICPACPQPGKNLPNDWRDAPPDSRWLYGLFFAIDANFRLKRKHVSSSASDPGISKGWAYFVEESAYKEYLEGHKHTSQERSTCVSHNAVNMADTKKSNGLAVTGVGAVVCAHHDMRLPNAVGDLQKGEKYINMDYVFFSAMRKHDLLVLKVSYDIACQWSKHLWSRMEMLPSSFRIDRENKCTTFLVPKFHLPAHTLQCQIDYSFNLTRHVGRTDGEAPERGWANINPIASSTKEMGPGSRRDTLDDHFGDSNWKRCTHLGRLIACRLTEAVAQHADHLREVTELESCLEVDSLEAWRKEVEAWESNSSNPNPFSVRVAPETQATVRLELARIEAVELESGANTSLHPDVSPSILISSGIDLEEQQCVCMSGLFFISLGAHATDNQLAKVQQHTNTLRRKIELWQDIQLLYMPFISCLRAEETSLRLSTEPIPVEAMALWLPSTAISRTPSPPHLLRYEWKLRYAQANDALKDMRNLLRLHSHLYTFKDNNIVGQAANTRARMTINKTEDRVNMAASRYEAAWAALASLAPLLNEGGTWKTVLKPLDRKKDVKALKDLWEKETQGTRHLSWIWKTPGVSEDASAGLHDALRIEWCKARACEMRWREEIELLREEQCRVVAFMHWHAEWWLSHRSRRDPVEDDMREGLVAYAERQASLRRRMADHFQALWSSPVTTTKSSIEDNSE
ncbi:hypothetical protein AZE42_11088 [Rhizopogon vesiculosus]|uniref:CxC2-like cysteine cluster KDZ transposase-associated domain-containing protein n=1 Tax=Rhizopogon vesiculosus TaxID=180088 RepID=A0A1J8PKE1_9AGAM|nr:hypothetical protein AZE42_11088 [Rhizopogon vesiculosus]